MTVTPSGDVELLTTSLVQIQKSRLNSGSPYNIGITFPHQVTCTPKGSTVVGTIIIVVIVVVVSLICGVCILSLIIHCWYQRRQDKILRSTIPHNAHVVSLSNDYITYTPQDVYRENPYAQQTYITPHPSEYPPQQVPHTLVMNQ
ncbi:hypothetical protein AKO1_005793 [Acrasis kona]|uniref:Uncharacterized protein n=1 Tax=Acrasis kona TaxID=1008807 RepID=A0AAW2YKE6_9EUKA